MAVIPEQYLDRLRAAGLVMAGPIPPDHVGYPDGVMIGKPVSAKGHSLPGYGHSWSVDEEGPLIDAPEVFLHRDAAKWVVTCHHWVPGPGPGDFVNQWDTPEAAVADILDYYFGSPARMDIHRQARAKVLQTLSQRLP